MGRGRAKAKQVKVARQLKYNGGGTDLDRLRAELGVRTDQQGADAYAHSDRFSGDNEDSADDDDDGDSLDDEDIDDEDPYPSMSRIAGD
ncbi:MAG: DUF3073 domain-containing protein [Streptosporangiaceae bacterium]